MKVEEQYQILSSEWRTLVEMGNWFSQLKKLYDSFGQMDARILMLGLDAAGKTTILYKLKLNEQVTTIPTIGFNVETVSPKKGISFTMWDVGGQDRIRKLWDHYFNGVEGIIFVVDSTDCDRFKEARDELEWILNADLLKGVPLVVLANKQDLPRACSVTEVTEALRMTSVKGREWFIQGSSAISGDGLYEGVDKMATMVKTFKKDGHHYVY